jgi:hypothetical protein
MLLPKINFSHYLKIKSKTTKILKKNEHEDKNKIKAIIGRKTKINSLTKHRNQDCKAHIGSYDKKKDVAKKIMNGKRNSRLTIKSHGHRYLPDNCPPLLERGCEKEVKKIGNR